MGILSKIKNRFKPSLDDQTKRFTSLKGFTTLDPNWQLTDCNGAYWKYNASTKGVHPLGDYKPSARGTWYVDLNVAQNRLHATVLLKKTMNTRTYADFDLNSYIGLIRASTLASGLIFELPIIIYFLTKIGLVTPEFLKKNRKYALVIVLIFAAIITPPDIASQVIVAIPVLVLYQVSILISKIVLRNQKRKETNG